MNNGNISRVCNGVFNSTRGRFFKFSWIFFLYIAYETFKKV
jgi:hypothetical protein